MIKICIVDDHQIFAESLQSLLQKEDSISDIRIFQNERDFYYSLKTETPDILLLDYNLKNITGFEVSQYLKKSYPSIKIILLSMINSPELFEKLHEMGVDGYLTKDTEKTELRHAIDTVMEGGKYYSQLVLNEYVNYSHNTKTQRNILKLTKRETEVVKLIVEGKTSMEIAGIMGISFNTIKGYRKIIYNKCNVKNSAELIAIAMKYKLT